MSWVYLFIAGIFEMVWALMLKSTEGWTRLWPSVMTLAAMFISFGFLTASLKTLPVGTAYAVWTGIGAAGTAIAGILFFGEPRSVLRLTCIFLVIAGIAGLKFTSGH